MWHGDFIESTLHPERARPGGLGQVLLHRESADASKSRLWIFAPREEEEEIFTDRANSPDVLGIDRVWEFRSSVCPSMRSGLRVATPVSGQCPRRPRDRSTVTEDVGKSAPVSICLCIEILLRVTISWVLFVWNIVRQSSITLTF